MNIPPNIELKSITKTYGRTIAVEAVDLSITNGECLALIGHNGAGKSTLIKVVLGLIQPTEGIVRVMGQEPLGSAFNNVRKNIGFLPEQVLFQNNMTGQETLEFYARLKAAPRDNLDQLFHRVDLFQARNNRISTYSKGMRQRLGLAQALIGTPSLLILDEPTSGLDPLSRQNVYGIINEAKQDGATILISSHALTELDARIDRVAILNQGKLMAVGTIAELRHNMGLHSKITIQAPPATMQTLEQHLSGKYDKQYFLNGIAQLNCPADEKIALLKDLMNLNIPYNNIEVNDPSLEQIFLAYTTTKENFDG